MARFSILLALAAATAAPLSAQRSDAPLGEIVDAIPDKEAAAAPAERRPPPVGVGRTDLPPSRSAPMQVDGKAVQPAAAFTVEDKRLAEVDAAERQRTDALNRAVTDRHEAVRVQNEEARAAYQRSVEAVAAEERRLQEEHRAALERHAREVARLRAAHEARVQACLGGDATACAQPGEK